MPTEPKPYLTRVWEFRAYPTSKPARALEAQLDRCRDLYNSALQQRRDAWHEHGLSVSFAETNTSLVTPPRASYPTCTECPPRHTEVLILVQVIDSVEEA
ncbi:MAG: helix-turn-helix domain-containing protein [Thermoleophilia bacterium]